MKTILIALLFAFTALPQSSKLLLLYDDYAPPSGYEFFITSDGKELKTSDGKYFLVKSSSEASLIDFNKFNNYVYIRKEENEKTNFNM